MAEVNETDKAKRDEFKCEACGMSFNSREEAERHMKEKHVSSHHHS